MIDQNTLVGNNYAKQVKVGILARFRLAHANFIASLAFAGSLVAVGGFFIFMCMADSSGNKHVSDHFTVLCGMAIVASLISLLYASATFVLLQWKNREDRKSGEKQKAT